MFMQLIVWICLFKFVTDSAPYARVMTMMAPASEDEAQTYDSKEQKIRDQLFHQQTYLSDPVSVLIIYFFLLLGVPKEAVVVVVLVFPCCTRRMVTLIV